ncbi:MAG: hypothetical protein HKN13_02185 [Rhodothermales bacterium]|nr:hypothetical protein [Rhodothermales bacterium]
MLKTLALVLAFAPTSADSVEHYYAHGDAAALREHCRAVATQGEDLLCRYRLYPLTLDRALLRDLPTESELASAREFAMLAGLWGYRASTGSIINKIRCGRKAGRLMDKATEARPDDPFVLLIEGQSLLFRPGIFGGDSRQALAVLRELQRVASREPGAGVSPLEADLWVWYALTRLDHPDADAARKAIEVRNPPPLFADFLANPPS